MSSRPCVRANATIHPTAIVEPDVEIGENCSIWDHVHIRGPSSIGASCIIGEKTYIAYGVRIGDVVKINAHVYVCTGVEIESRVMIAARVVFTNDRFPRAFGPDGTTRAPSEPNAETRRTTVRDGATIGAGAVVGPGVEIGRMAMVGMGSVIVHDVPAHGLVHGVPARLRGYVCICGAPLPVSMTASRGSGGCSRCGRRFEVSQLGTRAAVLNFHSEPLDRHSGISQ